jgi:KUP system potassium uptake protein
VYGDIGTSPLYAIRECFHGPHAIAATHENVLGVLSLIFWALIIVISVKYLAVVLRADNQGEGGILALTALATPIRPTGRSERPLLILIGIFGAALLYGDSMITPSISILGALEGLSVAEPFLTRFVLPIAVVILVLLFFIQQYGTATVGKIFGPIMVVWFTVLAVLGGAQVVKYPAVIESINPVHALRFFLDNGWHGYVVLGSVFLVMTGGEALYADMGHFGRRPIRLVWYVIVLPSLLLNYFGQGALLLTHPEAAENPFFRLAPDWATLGLVLLAVGAAVIASQAVISGAYSLTMQGVQLGFFPRIKIDHTSKIQYGQIYIGAINWVLMFGCIFVVLVFQTSSNLAAAYGIAVTGTMIITTVMLSVVARKFWQWHWLPTAALIAVLFVIDAAFLGANFIKVGQGGWFPLVLGALVFIIMTTWKRGRRILAERIQETATPLDVFLKRIPSLEVARVPGTAVFMNGSASRTPPALLHNLEHNKVLHDRVVFVTVKTNQVPHVEESERVEVESFGHGLFRIKVHYGFMEDPNIPAALAAAKPHIDVDPATATYFLGRETIIATKHPGMALWREKLFALIAHNATTATAYFGIPPDRVVELGEQIEI